ncbi:MAG: hypothetical protein AB1478_11785, partial [Nitrospirota bacterium]
SNPANIIIIGMIKKTIFFLFKNLLTATNPKNNDMPKKSNAFAYKLLDLGIAFCGAGKPSTHTFTLRLT